jgi:hypothetical protein
MKTPKDSTALLTYLTNSEVKDFDAVGNLLIGRDEPIQKMNQRSLEVRLCWVS